MVVKCHEEIDLDDCGGMLKDAILYIIEFEEHVYIILTKEGKEFIVEIDIN